MSPLSTFFAVASIAGPPVQSPSAQPSSPTSVPTPPTLPPDPQEPPSAPVEEPPPGPLAAEPPPEPGPTPPTDAASPAVPERPAVVLPPDFPTTVDPYDETTWGDLTLDQKDRLRALRASAVARAAEAAGPVDSAAVRDRAYARELQDVREARRNAERDDVQRARSRGRVIEWARPRLIGFGVSLGGGFVLSAVAGPVGGSGRFGAAIALGTIGGLGMIIGLPGVIATALIRSAHLRLDDPVSP